MDMSLSVTFAVLGAALLHACWNALLKGSPDKDLDSSSIAAGAGLLALCLAPWFPVPDAASLPWMGASMLVHIGYYRSLAAAYHWGEMSFAYPVMRGGGPVLVALAGVVLLGERLPPAEAAGAALVTGGILGLALGARPSSPDALRRSLAAALLNAAIIATYTLIDARGVRASGAPVAYALWFFVASGLVVFGAAWRRRGAELGRYAARHAPRVLLGGACSLVSYGVALWAMTRAPVALVAALRETSVVFAALIGAAFLGERLGVTRLLATAVVVAGLLVLRL